MLIFLLVLKFPATKIGGQAFWGAGQLGTKAKIHQSVASTNSSS